MRGIVCIFACLALAIAQIAQAPDAQAQNVAGRFDYYLLALSWSPTFCADPQAAARNERQCKSARPYAFVVHGLWPQHERGWPRDCQAQPADAPSEVKTAMLDLMPSLGLIEHQWDAHGKCAGLGPRAYFELTRRLRARVAIPPAYVAPRQTQMVTAGDVEAAFARANPGLTPAMIAVQCNRQRLREVRICFTKEGRFRACGRDVTDRCGAGKVAMPPVRSGSAR